MATPYGHGLAGGILYFLLNRKLPEGRGWGYFFLYAGVAASADLDLFLDLWTGETGRFHHGISHSLGAAALVGFLAAGTARIMGWRPARAFGIGFLLYASHVLLDTMTVDTKPPLGLQALWPLTDAFTLSPVPLFLDVWRWPFSPEMVRHNALTVLMETLILAPPFIHLFYARRRGEAFSRTRVLGVGVWVVPVVVGFILTGSILKGR